MKNIAIYPGSFDPVTNGHIDIIKRAVKLFDHVYIVVSKNYEKKPLFSIEERVNLLKRCLAELNIKNISVDSFSGFIYEYAQSKNASTIVRGLRTMNDFEKEHQLFTYNYRLSNKKVDTIFLCAELENLFTSSSTVKEVVFFKGDPSPYVPQIVYQAILKKMKTI